MGIGREKRMVENGLEMKGEGGEKKGEEGEGEKGAGLQGVGKEKGEGEEKGNGKKRARQGGKESRKEVKRDGS